MDTNLFITSIVLVHLPKVYQVFDAAVGDTILYPCIRPWETLLASDETPQYYLYQKRYKFKNLWVPMNTHGYLNTRGYPHSGYPRRYRTDTGIIFIQRGGDRYRRGEKWLIFPCIEIFYSFMPFSLCYSIFTLVIN